MIVGNSYSQVPLYYKFKKVSGTILSDNEEILITFHSRRKLIIKNCKNKSLEEFLRTLIISKTGRKQLEHIINSHANITVNVIDKMGFAKFDSKYHIIAGITTHPPSLSKIEYNGDSTYAEISISIFKRTIEYLNSPFKIDSNNSVYYNLDLENDSSKVSNLNYDSVKIEPLMFEEYAYKNIRELYYFCGVHEIEHTKTHNIIKQLNGNFGEIEYDAFKIELKEFRKRKKINRKKIKWFYK